MKKVHKYFLGGGTILLLAVFFILVWKMREGFVTKNKSLTKYYCDRWMDDDDKYGTNLQTGTGCSVSKNSMLTKPINGYIVFQKTGNTQHPVKKCKSYSYESGPHNCITI